MKKEEKEEEEENEEKKKGKLFLQPRIPPLLFFFSYSRILCTERFSRVLEGVKGGKAL